MSNKKKQQKKATIFDTNAYRGFTFSLTVEMARSKALKLQQLEHARGGFALAHPTVIAELLSHLVDPSDLDYKNCLSSIVALGEHAASRDPTEQGRVCTIADAFATVCAALFGCVRPDYHQGLQNLGTLVAHIRDKAPDLSDLVAKKNIVELTSNLPRREQAWLTGMKSTLTNFSPTVAKAVFGKNDDRAALRRAREYFASDAFQDAWAKYVVQTTGADAGIKLSVAELEAKGKLARKLFPVPFQLMCALLQKLATTEPPDLANPKRKRWNFIWDSMISFSIGEGTINGATVYLVTGDKELLTRQVRPESRTKSCL